MQKQNESGTAGQIRQFLERWRIPRSVIAEATGIPKPSLIKKLDEKTAERYIMPEDEAKLKSALSELRAEIDSLLK